MVNGQQYGEWHGWFTAWEGAAPRNSRIGDGSAKRANRSGKQRDDDRLDLGGSDFDTQLWTHAMIESTNG